MPDIMFVRRDCDCERCTFITRYPDGRDEDGYDIDGLSRDGYNRDGFNLYGRDREGYNRDGYDYEGYNRDGFNSLGWDRLNINRDGVPRYDVEGYDESGYDARGFNRDGFDIGGWDERGYDRDGFSIYGRDRDGYDREGRDYNGCDREGYRRDGFTYDGYDRDGYDRQGYDRDDNDRDGNSRYDERGYDADGFNCDGYDELGYDRDGYDENGYDAAGYNADGYNEDGYDRRGNYRYDDSDDYRDDYRDDSVLESYSYRPRPQFKGNGPTYYGIELEVTCDRLSDLVSIVREHAGDLIYCKADSSVDGAELVTHPMSYEWAMANFPWLMLPVLRADCDASVIPQENGIHVHVSRDGFSNPSHLYRWMKLWYRNPNDIQRIARRRANSWSSFNPAQRKAQKTHCEKFGKPDYDIYRDGTRVESPGRYAAINTTNEKTLEVRVFASTLRPSRAKAALQLVAASVEYTRGLNSDAVTHRHGWDWQAFISWAAKSGQYSELIAENRTRRPV